MGIAIERVDDKDVLPTHVDERPDLVLAIFERALLVLAEHQIEMLRHTRTVLARCSDRKQRQFGIPRHIALLETPS